MPVCNIPTAENLFASLEETSVSTLSQATCIMYVVMTVHLVLQIQVHSLD